jgi:molybdopterin-guanine dinucleotide biosynthesis protein A
MKVWPDIAELNKEQVKKIVELEKQLDAVLVAFKKPTTFANLSPEDLKKVQKLEKELGLTLLAMK